MRWHFLLSIQGKQSPLLPEFFKQGVGRNTIAPSLSPPLQAPTQAASWLESSEL